MYTNQPFGQAGYWEPAGLRSQCSHQNPEFFGGKTLKGKRGRKAAEKNSFHTFQGRERKVTLLGLEQISCPEDHSARDMPVQNSTGGKGGIIL